MKIRECYLLFAVCALPLAACDLQPKITGAFSAGGNAGPIDNIPTSATSQYGTMSSATDDVSARYGHLTQYANVGDYSPPKQNQIPDNSVKPIAQNNTAKYDLAPRIEKFVAPKGEPDDVLLVPARVATADKKLTIVPPKNADVVVARGDTLYSIARAHNVPVRDLADANNIAAPFAISVGQILHMPSARMHTVVAGDTLYSISRAYSVDVNSLAETNHLVAPYTLVVGQKLQLPASVSVPPTVAQTRSAVKPVAPPASPKAVAATAPKGSETTPVIHSTTANGTVAKLPSATKRSSSKFSWPVSGKIVSSFGAKQGGLYNDGINIAAARGTAVKAAENGVVAYAGNELKGMGNLIIIQHTGGWMTVYAHMDSMVVKRGARVVVGQKIGTVGMTGKVDSPQLHFEIRNGTKAYDPKKELK